MNNVLLAVGTETALQQPDWADSPALPYVRDELATRPALVAPGDVRRLRAHLAEVAAGRAHVIQTGDCAEDPADRTADRVAGRAALLDLLAGALRLTTRRPVLRIGRIAGQFGKPRSSATELVDGVELPVYRGHMVNDPAPDPDSRRPDPLRLLAGYDAAAETVRRLGWGGPTWGADLTPTVWTSHEALLLDYELPMLRQDGEGRTLLASTHFPWIGERTRQVDGAHVGLLAGVVNPVACKVGPAMAPDELLDLCERLDPWREPGRLTLIARMGAQHAAGRLPVLVEAVRKAGHPVVWLTDPMHGNTVSTASGLKTRLLDTVVQEVQDFQAAVALAGGVAGGLHLETTPDAVTECASRPDDLDRVGEHYTSFCDPRLNPDQALAVVRAWQG
ncbi:MULTISPECIES: 3-deoxy-7-phosphoheptulonate synthase [Kitasatospora]|uniref:Phospho-2-dehydro-3-deoxyheptonate aldolase n=1 Tax=Kitasatospora setae (strain ATCC 33774 / DSM 43861 / JCM 3304 / KCC A-0304 / NBRC 14216 / KM-6054) TaxID=452652 RepID=E4N0J1_KITSK|nr:3-deoxy-7-phosphoheptulonate synthase [Kitasatospora setae]BAJ31675.1 putative phospho-2-dehydro-3-deoxyheptonate aldolase [Kitasatospora setae KM-6054]